MLNSTTAASGTNDGVTLAHLSLLLAVIPILTIFGNLLVVLSVLRERSLQSVTNYLIVSLAVADFLVALCVMPFAIYIQMHDLQWLLSNWMCNMWISCDVTASTASILNLVAISFDRYLAITHPIQYSKQGKSCRRALYYIFAVWAISLSIALPIVFGINKLEEETLVCEFTNYVYIITSSFLSFFFPCVFMSAMYLVILLRLRDRQRRKHPPTASSSDTTAALRKSRSATNGPSSEHLGAALFGGAQLAKEMGRRLRERSIADDLLAASSSRQDTSSDDDDDEDDTSTSTSPPPKKLAQQQRQRETVVSPESLSLSPTNADDHRQRQYVDASVVTASTALPPPTTTARSNVVGVGDDDERTSALGGDISEQLDSRFTATDQTISPLPVYRKQTVDNRSKYLPDDQSISTINRSFGDELIELFPYIDAKSRDNSSSTPRRQQQQYDNNRLPSSKAQLTSSPSSYAAAVTTTVLDVAPIVGRDSIENFAASTPHESLRGVTSANDADNYANGGDTTWATMVTAADSRAMASHLSPSTSKGGALGQFTKRMSIVPTAKQLGNSVTRAKQELIKKVTDIHISSFKPHTRRLEKKVKKHIRRERKATVTLAVVLAVFLVCWVPFFTLHLTNAVCTAISGRSCIGYLPFLLTTWLGYMNSFMNPIIYTIFNPEYRKAFRRLLGCTRAAGWR